MCVCARAFTPSEMCCAAHNVPCVWSGWYHECEAARELTQVWVYYHTLSLFVFFFSEVEQPHSGVCQSHIHHPTQTHTHTHEITRKSHRHTHTHTHACARKPTTHTRSQTTQTHTHTHTRKHTHTHAHTDTHENTPLIHTDRHTSTHTHTHTQAAECGLTLTRHRHTHTLHTQAERSHTLCCAVFYFHFTTSAVFILTPTCVSVMFVNCVVVLWWMKLAATGVPFTTTVMGVRECVCVCACVCQVLNTQSYT